MIVCQSLFEVMSYCIYEYMYYHLNNILETNII